MVSKTSAIEEHVVVIGGILIALWVGSLLLFSFVSEKNVTLGVISIILGTISAVLFGYLLGDVIASIDREDHFKS